jgi:hypothetical protein
LGLQQHTRRKRGRELRHRRKGLPQETLRDQFDDLENKVKSAPEGDRHVWWETLNLQALEVGLGGSSLTGMAG